MFKLDSHVTHTKNLAATDMVWEPIPAFGWGFFGQFGKYYDDALRM